MIMNQKLRKQGGSYLILVPMEFIKFHQLKEGDILTLNSDIIKFKRVNSSYVFDDI